jgi:hypothetical protein
VLIEVKGGFFDRVECNPIPPYGYFTLFAGKLDGRISMVFVTIIVIRTKNVFGHFLFPLFAVTGFETTSGWKRLKIFLFRVQH